MTIKEIFTTIERHNMIAQFKETQLKYVCFELDDTWLETFNNYDDFETWLKDEFNSEFANKILTQDYFLNKTKIFAYRNYLNEVDTVKLKFTIIKGE